MLKILFTGGGTAGHVTPNVALINRIKELRPDAEIYYVGSEKGIENDIIGKLPDVKYYAIPTGKMRRYLSIENLKDIFRVQKGYRHAKKLVKEIQPDVLFSKGGYVAVPVVAAAGRKKVPVLSHESDITPGLANMISLRHAKKVCTTFPDTLKRIPGKRGIFTGTPIRKELYAGSETRAKELLSFDDKPVILVMGGSIGSVAINNAIRNNLKKLTEKYNIIHLCGKGRLSEEPEHISNPSYRQFEFVSEELPDYLALADIIVSRSGANAIHEFLALKKPMLLIPLPSSASRGDQLLNAESFRQRGIARVLQEENINEETLSAAVDELYASREELIENMSREANIDGTEKIANLILEYAEMPRKKKSVK